MAKAPTAPVPPKAPTAPVAPAPAAAPTAAPAAKFKLEDGVAIPAITRTAAASQYPFAEMKEGQSFFVECADDAEKKTMHNRIGGAYRRYIERAFPKDREGNRPSGAPKFTVMKVDGGVRCWRLNATQA